MMMNGYHPTLLVGAFAAMLHLSCWSAVAWQSHVISTIYPNKRIHQHSDTILFSTISPENTDSNGWSVVDDWESLSSENLSNTIPDSATLLNQDIAALAAQSILADNHGEIMEEQSEEDVWLSEAIEEILRNPISSTPLYDTRREELTPGTAATTTAELSQKEFEDHMGKEIAMLVRCNQTPEQMLVETGRALKELSMDEKQHLSQLLVWDTSFKKWEPTPFYQEAVATIFRMYATTGESDHPEPTMDAKAVARWMTQSLGSDLDSYTQRNAQGKDQVVTRERKTISIKPHDKNVLTTLTKYSTYGTGKINPDGFLQLYADALVCTQSGMMVKEDLELLQLHNADHVRQVWRDLNNHDILGPVEQQWQTEKAKLEAEYGSLQQQMSRVEFMDECELLDLSYDAPPSDDETQAGHDAKNNRYIKKSSHEEVQLAADGKTPLYMKEGDFVFIDEESCIGCMQCVNAAPASFLMLENGRARTFHQRKGDDVKQGVAACPVSCMHFVSFDELEELETARDNGDGRGDHKHMGHQRGHTPLFVAGIDSDNNHRSSWYHHLKNKCDNTGQCPQRGCFDCPSYRNSGDSPFFKKRVKEAQHTRAQYFIDHGDVDLWRKAADL